MKNSIRTIALFSLLTIAAAPMMHASEPMGTNPHPNSEPMGTNPHPSSEPMGTNPHPKFGSSPLTVFAYTVLAYFGF